MSSEAIATPPRSLFELLAGAGEKLSPELKAEIVARVPSVVPELIAFIEDDELAFEEAVGAGWIPVHAADLLVDLRAESAIDALLAALVRGDEDGILMNKIAVRLPELGPVVFEPARRLLEATIDEFKRDVLVSVIAKLGVRDERIFTWCKARFEADPVLGSISLADYGDERALPLLRRAIEEFEPDWTSPYGARDLADFTEAYERIAGQLPSDLAEHVADVRAEHAAEIEATEESFRPALEALKREALARIPAVSTKVGRNDPCPCGSGKKFKKCCGA